jgi:hypothetical protein
MTFKIVYKYRLCVVIPIISAIILFFFPYTFKTIATFHEMPDVDPVELKNVLGLDQLPIDAKELDAIWWQYPRPSFEKIDGQLAFFKIYYSQRDAVYLKKDEGFRLSAKRLLSHWPLTPQYFDRTVIILESRYSIFPEISPEHLRRFNNSEIYVLGYLNGRSRLGIYATGFALIVSYIGFLDSSNKVRWIHIKELDGS